MLKKFNTLFEEVSTFLEKENKLNSDSGTDSSEGGNNTAEECCDGGTCDAAEPNTDVTPAKPGITTDDVKEMYVGTLPFKKIQKRKDFGY